MQSEKCAMQQLRNKNSNICGLHDASCNPESWGFTLLEVMISLAIVGGLLVTLIYTLNYHLGIADRHGVATVSMSLAKEKLYEMEKNPSQSKGLFPEPYSSFSYETAVKDSTFPGLKEITVLVKSGKEETRLSELIRKSEGIK